MWHGNANHAIFSLASLGRASFEDVAYFDNLLPDSELIRERIQARFNVPSKKSFDLLSFIGGDCVGALQLLTQPIATREVSVFVSSDARDY